MFWRADRLPVAAPASLRLPFVLKSGTENSTRFCGKLAKLTKSEEGKAGVCDAPK